MIRIMHFLTLICLVNPCQSQTSLKERLWERVKPCYSRFEDTDGDGKLDMSGVVDDSKNGYLSVSGGWPTCGCECSSTVGAYKHSDGSYTLLQYDESNCDWRKELSSDGNLKDLLPEDLGINTFIPNYQKVKSVNAVFFLRADIPQIGTDTKLYLELIPFGLEGKGNEIISYGYSESKPVSRIIGIKDIASSIKDENTLNFLLQGSYEKINPSDRKIINEAIATDKDDDSRFKSKEELNKHLRILKNKYDLYMLVECTQIVLEWDKDKGKFHIKEKSGKFNKISFKEFLVKNEYWDYRC